ncbi:MAG: hypothetical protein IJ826_05435 [Bacteroidaceae bacterium]|nr:hypothetical protein [Bacteroidaceae bacterium]
MKTTLKNILLATLSAFAFTCCEDVPAPYQIPGTERKVPDKDIQPSGDGTFENPFNVAGVLEYISKLQADTESPQQVYVKGKVLQNSTDEATITQHGNMSFTMIDEGNKSKTFLAWQVMGPGKKKFTSTSQIKTGDEVIVCGKVINYKGNTPETVNKGQAFVYSINGNSEGGDTPPPSSSTKEAPLTVAQAKSGSGNNYVKGYIVGYVDKASLAEGSVFGIPSSAETEVLLADSPDETDPANVLPVQLPVGDVRTALELYANPGNLKKEVLLYGSLETYFGTIGMKSTSWGKLGETTFGTDPEGGGEGGGTEEGTSVTCAQAVEYTNALADGATSTETYTITGYITEVVGTVSKNQQSFWMADTKDGGQVFYSFWANLPEGVTEFVKDTKVKITGQLIKYVKNNVVTPEMKNATVEILEAGEGGESGEGGDTSEYATTYEVGDNNFLTKGVATVNEVANCLALKIGTSSKAGDFAITVPAGKHSFYAVTWYNLETADVILKNGEEVLETIAVKGNEGATGNSPFTLTVTEADKYEFEVSAQTTVTFTSDKRIIFFGIK